VKTSSVLLIGLGAVVLAAGGGYRLGQVADQPNTRAIAAVSETPVEPERKPLYYRNPMGLPDTSPVPKKDPMGMDYIPVYADEQDEESAAANQVAISTAKVQKLGVRTDAARMRVLDKQVRAVGRVTPDERRTFVISPKFEGYVERLYVNITGQPVNQGQALFEVYSPELISAQREYALAAQGVESLREADGYALAGMQQLAEASLLRLRNWDISEQDLKALAASGEVRRTLTFRSPVSGIVTEKMAVEGMRFMPGETLFKVADLSSIWVVADVFEQDIGLIRTGAQAQVLINAYPDKQFTGTITYVYPSLDAQTRTVPVRIELPNTELLLKPDMYAQVELPAGTGIRVLTVPTSAVIDSGARRIVLIQAGEGRYEPREVRLGQRGDSHIEVIEGVKEGEVVVVTANFLIDAESNLKAAISGFGEAPTGESPATGSPLDSTATHKGEGTVISVNSEAGSITLKHAPIASLNWPAMTMDFAIADASQLSGLGPEIPVSFEFREGQPGEWIITAIAPAAGENAAAEPHANH